MILAVSSADLYQAFNKQVPVPVIQVSVLQAPVLNKQVTVPVVEVLVRYAPVLKKTSTKYEWTKY